MRLVGRIGDGRRDRKPHSRCGTDNGTRNGASTCFSDRGQCSHATAKERALRFARTRITPTHLIWLMV